MNFFVKELTEQIYQWKRRRDELDDLIDYTYTRIDEELDQVRVLEFIDQVREWNNKRDDLDDLIDLAYERIDQSIS